MCIQIICTIHFNLFNTTITWVFEHDFHFNIFGSVGFLGQRIIEDEFGDCGLLTKFKINSDKSDDERRFFGVPIFGDRAAVVG
ncbi:hypothetical protein Hdeb2414_s0011g00370071 [Helianthus debilis subsp. tardiflorus]